MTTQADAWERFLDPEAVRPSLFLATMFIATFEILKDSIVDRIRDFYANAWDENGPAVSLEYQRRVLSRNKSVVYASLDWLVESGAINEQDLETFQKVKKARNRLAHKLFAVVTGQMDSDHESQFPVLVTLLRKIEVWWVVNMEIGLDTDDGDQEIDEDGIDPGPILSLQMLIEVASGNTALLDAWREARR